MKTPDIIQAVIIGLIIVAGILVGQYVQGTRLDAKLDAVECHCSTAPAAQ